MMNPRLVVGFVDVTVCAYMLACLGHSRISDIVLEGHQSVPLVQFQVSVGQMVRLPTGCSKKKTCQVRTATGGKHSAFAGTLRLRPTAWFLANQLSYVKCTVQTNKSKPSAWMQVIPRGFWAGRSSEQT